MENDILDSLEDLGYKGDLLNENCLTQAVTEGPKSVEFTKAVEWICVELKILGNLEETVNAISSQEDTSNFLIEISSFLKELGCVYTCLTEGHLSERLGSKDNCLLLLDYLLSELMAARMIRVEKPHLTNVIELKLQESDTAADLKSLLIALKFPKPPENITSAALFSKVEQKLSDTVKQVPAELVGKPLFTGTLSDKQWHQLGLIAKELQSEYKIRREMLITRLDVTTRSFQWSERVKNRENEITDKFLNRRKKMEKDSSIGLSDLLAAREDLAVLEKTSNASVRKNTQSEINKVIIGRVPDRGGRPSEQEAPPPEMPSWQKDRAPGGGGGGGGFSRGGGRVQGGWNQGRGGGNQDHRGGGRGGYQGNRGGGRGGYDNRDGGRGGYDNRDGGRSGYDNRDGGRGGHDNRDGGRGGYDNRDGGRSGYDNRDGGRGGHDNRDGGRGGHDNRDGGRGGYDNRDGGRGGGYHENRGGERGDSGYYDSYGDRGGSESGDGYERRNRGDRNSGGRRR